MNTIALSGIFHTRSLLAQLVPVALCCAASLMALPATAQTSSPLSSTTVDQLVAMLRLPKNVKALNFQRTRLPDANHRCQAAVSGKSKNLVVYDTGHSFSADLAVQFANGADKLDGNDRQLLQTLAQALNDPRLGQGRFAIAGHASRTGDDKINLELSCARAIAARNYLVSQGVAGDRLDAFGFGSDRPLQGVDPVHDKNRRVEIRRDVDSTD